MASKRVTVCDVCERVGVPTERYRIMAGGRRYELDLCLRHAGPILDLVKDRTGQRARPRRFEDALEELEKRERNAAEAS